VTVLKVEFTPLFEPDAPPPPTAIGKPVAVTVISVPPGLPSKGLAV
jgi:hypothetical protein